ncbi:uncharacterized protein LOC136093608 [Hydra vulgaris]|uniref:uncharacterized protein LOC136093336 n=1 Tax=Hydra vulgaris TaxID=6087 RepID=UPI0032EA03FE
MQQKVAPAQQSAHIQPKTILSKMGSLNKFLDFLKGRQIYIGLNTNQLSNVSLRIKEISSSLKPFLSQREFDLKNFKKLHVITPEVFLTYENSEHIVQVKKILNSTVSKPTFQEAIDIRDYLMVLICFWNATRSSNLINMTIQDFEDAYQDPEYPGAVIFRSDRYKTSMIYGTKIIVVDKELQQFLTTYVDFFLPVLLGQKTNKTSPLFATKSKSSMTQSAVANGMTTSFKKAQVFDDEKKFGRVCPTRIRISIASELACQGEEGMEDVATLYMKNKPQTTKRFYVTNFNERKSARISIQVGQHYGLAKKFQVNEMSSKKLKKWLAKTAEQIKSISGEEYVDTEINQYLSKHTKDKGYESSDIDQPESKKRIAFKDNFEEDNDDIDFSRQVAEPDKKIPPTVIHPSETSSKNEVCTVN